MGLIKSAITAVKGTFADQWVDYIRCDAMPETVLMRPGRKTIGNGSSNTKSTDNIITNGSKIDVADGQCMLIVENGLIVDYCQEPGQYIYDYSSQPSLLGGGVEDLGRVFAEVGKRWAAGGTPTTTQKVYFINLLEIHGNKIGVGNVPFRDSEFGFTVKVQGYGTYSYRINNPLLFYANLAGNVVSEYSRDRIDSQMKSELIAALQPALGRIAQQGISYDQLINYPKQIGQELNQELSEEWVNRRGIVVESVALESLTVDDESADKISKFQESRVYAQNNGMLNAQMGLSQAEAFKNMGKNPNGVGAGDMMGMTMGAMAMGMMNGMNPNIKNPAPDSAPTVVPTSIDSWTCECGVINTGKFCSSCGKPKQVVDCWVCSCGKENRGKFCSECGSKKPAGALQYECDKCGWVPTDPKNPPKFCENCGDPFGDEDIK